jgi:hypothetical protein
MYSTAELLAIRGKVIGYVYDKPVYENLQPWDNPDEYKIFNRFDHLKAAILHRKRMKLIDGEDQDKAWHHLELQDQHIDEFLPSNTPENKDGWEGEDVQKEMNKYAQKITLND